MPMSYNLSTKLVQGSGSGLPPCPTDTKELMPLINKTQTLTERIPLFFFQNVF